MEIGKSDIDDLYTSLEKLIMLYVATEDRQQTDILAVVGILHRQIFKLNQIMSKMAAKGYGRK